jgi:glycosyltransferase involved in cell wall biosynthesis
LQVVLLSNEYPPFIYGGVGTFVKNLAIGLCRERVRVTIISGYPVPRALSHVKRVEINEEKDAELNIIRFPYLDIHPKNAFFQLLNLKKIYETIKDINPDIVHGQSLSTFPALIKLKNLAPIIVTFHTSPKTEKTMSVYSFLRGGSFDDFGTHVIGYPALSFIFRKELCNSNMAVAVSKNLMSELLEEMGETYRERIREIHNGIDIETLEREYKSAEDDVEEANDTLLFAGRLVWRKGALNLIKIAYFLQKEKLDFKLIVHGDGALFRSVKKAVQNFRLTNVELKGFTSRAQMMRSMRRSKFVVIPSFYEACPMILLESMCLGKIPVTFNLPYSVEFTENGKYGIMAKNTKDLVEQLKIAYKKLDLESFSDKVKDFARRKYNIKNMSVEYLNLYKDMLI